MLDHKRTSDTRETIGARTGYNVAVPGTATARVANAVVLDDERAFAAIDPGRNAFDNDVAASLFRRL